MEKIIIGDAILYCGDCYEILPEIKADALISDPPYGIKMGWHNHKGKRRGVEGKAYAAVKGDDQPFDPTPFLGFPMTLIWGANHYAHRLPHIGRWLIWDKRCGVIPERSQADGEMAWCSTNGAARIFRHVWDGMVKDSERGVPREHPTQKPVALMKWCLKFAPDAEIIFDPFMGSGTTGVAAMEEGRKFIGVEFSRKYFEVARQRIEEAQKQIRLF